MCWPLRQHTSVWDHVIDRRRIPAGILRPQDSGLPFPPPPFSAFLSPVTIPFHLAVTLVLCAKGAVFYLGFLPRHFGCILGRQIIFSPPVTLGGN